MDAADPGEDEQDKTEDDEWLQNWKHIAQILGQIARSGCGACAGTGMCSTCGGNGRILVRDQGSVACGACIGDGSCTACKGTGQPQAA